MTLEEISVGLRSVGDLYGSEKTVISSIQTDSRLVRPGDLFICLCGQNMDGHVFADQAVKNGAAAVVSHHPMPGFSVPVMLVEDTLKALGRLGRYWRFRKGKNVVAITGSAGKTTTKEMLSDVLGTAYKTGRNYKNWNNQIGLPLSILKFSGEEDFWVLELGINNPYDMDELGEIACPDQAVILNVGPCHLQGLENVEGVARSKALILDHLQGPHRAFVCRDYTLLEKELDARPGIKPVWFSCMGKDAVYSLEYTIPDQYKVREGRNVFDLESVPGGEQYCENICAVWAVARHAGMTPAQITAGLRLFRAQDQRFSVYDLGPWTIIDDTYNANPLSMSRAVKSARKLAGNRDLLLVLGDMAELGHAEAEAHEGLGRLISEVGCQGILYFGKNAGIVRSALNSGHTDLFFEIRNQQHFKSLLTRLGSREGTILFKGSRSTGMENYVKYFREWYQENSRLNSKH